MIETRYEEYNHLTEKLPFILRMDLERTAFKHSNGKNWHENLEIQLCTEGEGSVLLNGERYDIEKNDIVVVNSNVIHDTFSERKMAYTCLIVSAEFCKQINIEYDHIQFTPFIKDPALVAMFEDLISTYKNKDDALYVAKLNKILLDILIKLVEDHFVTKQEPVVKTKSLKNVKATVRYIRENYQRKLSLDEISKAVYTDKYVLCRDFKKMTNQTIVEYTNNYRCQRAANLISEGYTVAEAAEMCGFENLSFFTKTFKKHLGALPSDYKSK